ncbi:alpha-amylase [Streptomyces sp. NPDC052012]|uniref:alpha-amylase n=1 Tax=Streptomyces sp. NPDC052012 TaxID=3155051 RepID=UPI00344FC945
MPDFMQRASRPFATATIAAAGLMMALTASHSAVAATEPAAPDCVQYFQSWRYTDVVNGCDDAVAVTVEYTNGQWAPCRVVQPGASVTFAGYGTDGNYVTGLLTCDPNLVTQAAPAP